MIFLTVSLYSGVVLKLRDAIYNSSTRDVNTEGALFPLPSLLFPPSRPLYYLPFHSFPSSFSVTFYTLSY